MDNHEGSHGVRQSPFTTANLTYLFPAPFVRHVWDDGATLNVELRRAILARERASLGITRSNVGGWHSEPDTLAWCGKAGETLVRQIFELANYATYRLMEALNRQVPNFKWVLYAWANVSRPGTFNQTHLHTGATWSGTYYVDTGDPPPKAISGTPLVLYASDPGRQTTFMPDLVPNEWVVKPEPGLMVLFPGYLPHAVFPHNGKRPRISIAFNLRKEPFP